MKQLFRHTSTLLRTALLLGAILLFGTGVKGQTAGLPDAFETMNPADIIGDGQYYYIQFYDGNDRSYLSDEGNGKDLRSKDYMPFAKNLQWTLEATGTDGQFYLKSRSGHYVYLDGSNYKGGSINKSALTATLRTNSTSGGGYDISTVSAPSYAMGRQGSSGIAPPWTNITSINHNNHRIVYTRLRIAKLKDNIAHIIYWQEPVRDKNGNVVDRNQNSRGGVDGFANRHYMTYSGTDASNDDGNFRTSTVSSRSSILTTYANWYLATAAAYHKDGLWTLEESDVDGEFFIKKYGTQDYLNGVQRSGDGFYLSDLGTKGDVYKLEQPKVNRYTRIQHLDESTEPLTADMFKTWDGYGAGATGTGDATVDFNVGNGASINAGGLVVGTSNVYHLIYADLSAYSKMTISGTPGMQLRAQMSRQESENGPYVEKDVTIGSDGKAVVDLTNLELQETNDPNQQFATQNGTATVKMTYVNYDDPTRQYNEIAAGESARSGYNNISDGSVGFVNTGWGVNYITYLQVDARAIPGKITKVTLKADVSGSTDSQRTTGWGVGYNNSTWSATMTYNNADKSITNLSDGLLQWTSTKSATTFENKTFDITGAFTVDALKKVATILVYETAAAGGYIKNPTVEVEYTPYVSNVPITFAHLNAIKAGWGSPSGTISSITLSKDNDNQRYLHHAHGDGWQVLQRSGNDEDYWYAGFYPVEVVDKDEFYQVLLKYGDNMVGVESDQTATLKPYNDFNPEKWDLEQVDDYGHFRFRWWNGTCYNGIGNALTTADPTGNDIGIYSNSDINSMFTVQWLPKTEKRIPYEVTHKESNVRLYYTYNPTTPARQKVYGQQGLITDADSEWWDHDKGTQKVNEFKITHYVKKGEPVEFGLPTVLSTNNDHRLFQRWYNYDNDRDLIGLKNHFRLKAKGVEVMSYLYNNGIVTGEKLDWGTIFPGARTFELNYLTFNNCDGESFTLAADVSRYSDFEYANASSHLEGNLQEPSLTMRYIYVMHDAKVMARDLMDNTVGSDNWLETKDFHFPATRVAYETSKPEKYQGEFIGIRHQFKDYWVFNTTDQNGWTDDNLVSAVTNSTSGHIEVVVDANGTGITLGGKDNKGYYLYDEGKDNNANSKAYGDSRFVAFKYPDSGTVSATGEDNAAYVKVYFKYNNTRYQIAKFKIIFDENTSTLPWTSVNGSGQVKDTDRDPKNLEKKAGRPIAKVSFDYPTGATFKNSSEYNIHNNGVMEGLWGEIANSSPLPLTFEKTNYGFDGDNPSWGSYALVTTMPTRYGNNKTTSPANDETYGYNIAPDKGMQSAFLYIDASEQPGDICAIPFTGEFCSGDKLMCTGWISGSNRMFNDNRCPGSVILTVKGETFDGKEVPIYRFCPGQCYELDNGTGIDGVTGSDHVVWQQFYFEFEVQRKFLRQWVEVNNNCVSSTGGDFMLDNIEVYAMVPSVEAEMNTPLCIDHEASEMQLLKFTVGFDKLLYNSNINEATSGDGTPHYLGLAFLEKNVFLSTLKEQLHYTGTLSELETAIDNGEYQNILTDNRAAYEAAFDAALLGDKQVWNSWQLTSNEGAGLLNFRWYDNFSQMDTYSFAKAVNKENSIFGYTDPDTGERLLVMNGNYPKLPWKANTDYYIISSVSGISSDFYSDFNICSECSKATPFQVAPPYEIFTMEATSNTEEVMVCEGTIPTLVTDLKGYDFNGVEVPMNDINYDWWLGDKANGVLPTLENYHAQQKDGVKLDVALSTLRIYYPDATSLDGIVRHTAVSPHPALTTAMVNYLKDLVNAGQLVLHQKSISVPAKPTSEVDPYFYLVACPIHDEQYDQSLNPHGPTSIINNGTMEGFETASFYTRYNNINSNATISGGVGKNGSRGISVTSAAAPSGEPQDWDSQFFIRANEVIPVGTTFHLEFDYKASSAATVHTQFHSEPSNCIYFNGAGDLGFTTEWKHFKRDIEVTSDMAPNNNFQSIAFDLWNGNDETGNGITYFFDNVELTVNKNYYVAFFCDEPQGLRVKVGEKAPTLKTGFVSYENGFSSYDYSGAGDAILSIRLAKREQFETVKHGEASEAAITNPANANADFHFLWLPIRDALVQSGESSKVIQKSEDENIYLASTNDPTWDKAIYQSMKKGSLPIVGKIVQLNAIDVSKSGGGTENDNNRLCVYFTENFDVREGYNYTLSLPFQESPGENTCDGTILINLKIVPDYEVWTGGAGSTDWNNDANWRRADGNTGAATETPDGSKRNNNELYRTNNLPDESPLKDYVTNYGNYRTAKDRILRKGFAPLYCTHILLKSNEWADAPQLYDALNGKADLDDAPFPNLSETVTQDYTVITYGIDQRFNSIADLSGQSFAIVNESEGKVIYGTNNQNLGYAVYEAAYQPTNSCYYFKLEDGPNGSYLLRAYAPSGEPYVFNAWGRNWDGYLNSQPLNGTVSFVLGLGGWDNIADRYGMDGQNLGLWIIEENGGKFALKNVGTGGYLKDSGVANNATPTYFTFCTLEENTEVETRLVNQNNILKFDLQARLYDIWSDTYGSAPNKGRTGDLIAEMYQINSCDEIAFQPGAELLNAHLLNYNSAWVEYKLDMNRWYLLGSPLQGTISGEWYAPSGGATTPLQAIVTGAGYNADGSAQQTTTYYEDVKFGEGYDRYSPAIFQRSWDKAKAVLYEVGAEYATTDNPDDLALVDGQQPGSPLQGLWNSGNSWSTTNADDYLDRLGYKPLGNKKVNVAIKGVWSNTYNDATVDYTKGGFSVMVLNNLKGKSNVNPAIIRLPKEDTMYDYYKFEETGAANGGTDTYLSDTQENDYDDVQTNLHRALNRGRLKTDLLLPSTENVDNLPMHKQIQRTETTASRYGDARTYTRVPWTVGEHALPMTKTNNNALRSFTESVSAGISNLGYYLVENPFVAGLDMEKFFAENPRLEQKYWIITPNGQQLVQRIAGDDWVSPTEEVVTGEDPNTETTYHFTAANAKVAPGQGFFVQATTPGESTDITFTADMQAQTRYGEPDAGEDFTIVVGTKQVMQEVPAVDEEGNPLKDDNNNDIMVETPVVDNQGNPVTEDITETVTIYKYKQKKGDGYEFPLKARTRSGSGKSLPGMVITARRESLQSSALVMRRNEASDEFLPSEDTEVFLNSDLKNIPTVYTLCGRLATTINSIHDFTCLPLGVESDSDAPCVLTFEGVEQLGDSVAFYDAVEQKLTPLESGMKFSVSGQTQNRYYLVRSLDIDEAAAETHLQIFTEGLTATVIASTQEPITSVRCTDAAGRLILVATPNAPTFSFRLPAAGVYVIEAQTEHDRKVQKHQCK